MKNFFIFFFAFFAVSAPAQESLVTRYFLTLPDSIFTTHRRAFAEKDSFPISERKKMLVAYENSVDGFGSDTVRFALQSVNDSTNELQFSDLGEVRVTLKIIQQKRGSTFLCVMSEECDFVMCPQVFHFYTVSKKKITEEFPLPSCYPADLFFDKKYLDAHKDSLQGCVDCIELHFIEDAQALSVSINYECFDPELFGNDPMTKFDEKQMVRQAAVMKLRKKKYVFE